MHRFGHFLYLFIKTETIFLRTNRFDKKNTSDGGHNTPRETTEPYVLPPQVVVINGDEFACSTGGCLQFC